MVQIGFCAIGVVLDRSGSMGSCRDSTIAGFNEFLKGQQQVPGRAVLTLAQFDNVYEIVHDFRNLHDVPGLTVETYVPRGSTALLDAMGKTIDDLGLKLAAMPEAERPDRVVVAVITDGYENASTKYSRQMVFDRITHQKEKYGWEFLFLGAHEDAIAAAGEIGIDAGHAIRYAQGMEDRAFSMVNDRARFARGGMERIQPFTDEERNTLSGADPDSKTEGSTKTPVGG